jgi:hypothetical protein
MEARTVPRLAIIAVTHDSSSHMGAWLRAIDSMRERVDAESAPVDMAARDRPHARDCRSACACA